MRRRDFLKGTTASGLMCACGQHAWGQPRGKRRRFCGFVDPQRGGGISIRNYGLKGAARRKVPLTWGYDKANAAVPGIGGADKVTPIIQQAFAKWSAAAPKLGFSNSANGPWDILFKVADLGGYDKASEITLADTNEDGTRIQISNNSNITFVATAAVGSASMDLLSTLTHEIGHALGLLHSSSDNSLMNPLSDNQELLGSDDTAAIRVLYGWDPQSSIGFGTDFTPAICACGNTLAMVWRGAGSNHNLWIATSTDGKKWSAQRQFSDVGSLASPGLAWDGTRLWMVWRGSPDQGIYYKTSTDFFVKDNPAQQHVNGVGTSNGPRIAIVSGTPTMAWKGSNDDKGIYFSQFQGGKWQPQARVPGVGTENSPAICQDLGGGARLLWRGVGDDHVLYTTKSGRSVSSWDPQQQVSWTIPGNGSTGGNTKGIPGSTVGPSLAFDSSSNPPVIHAAWHGAKGDSQIWYSRLTNDTVNGKFVIEWADQANIPGAGTSDGPSLTPFKGKVHVVWKGVVGDAGIWTTVV